MVAPEIPVPSEAGGPTVTTPISPIEGGVLKGLPFHERESSSIAADIAANSGIEFYIDTNSAHAKPVKPRT